jgi:YegS/Rv2252/BmrU family lipid kinase
MPKRALLLLNHKARQGQSDLGACLTRLEDAGYELIPEAKHKNPSDLVRAYANRVDLVIIGGGDGSLNAAVDGLVDTQLPLGILPLGTANDLARTLDIPLEPNSASEVILKGNQRRIDLGWVNGKHFFNVASVGLSVEITKELTRETKSRWGKLAYLLTSMRVLYRARPFSAEIRTEGERLRVRTLQIAVGNGRYYGGGMTVHADAQIDDQTLHLYSLEIDRWWKVFPLLPIMRLGAVKGSTNLRVLTGTQFDISLPSRRRPINADGEIVGQTPCRIRLVPRALSVFAPVVV